MTVNSAERHRLMWGPLVITSVRAHDDLTFVNLPISATDIRRARRTPATPAQHATTSNGDKWEAAKERPAGFDLPRISSALAVILLVLSRSQWLVAR